MTNKTIKIFIAVLALLPGLFLNAGVLRAAGGAENPGGARLNAMNLAAVLERPAADIPAPSPALRVVQPAQDKNAGSAQPDFNVTPGHLCTPTDPNFKEYRYAEHIAYCNRNVTKQMKQQVAASYNVPQASWSSYEFDHLIPLCIGGDSSVDNLWPQPRGAADSDGKDKLENDLYKQMVAGTITQQAAVQRIYDWFKGYKARHPATGNTPSGRALN